MSSHLLNQPKPAPAVSKHPAYALFDSISSNNLRRKGRLQAFDVVVVPQPVAGIPSDYLRC